VEDGGSWADVSYLKDVSEIRNNYSTNGKPSTPFSDDV